VQEVSQASAQLVQALDRGVSRLQQEITESASRFSGKMDSLGRSLEASGNKLLTSGTEMADQIAKSKEVFETSLQAAEHLQGSTETLTAHCQDMVSAIDSLQEATSNSLLTARTQTEELLELLPVADLRSEVEKLRLAMENTAAQQKTLVSHLANLAAQRAPRPRPTPAPKPSRGWLSRLFGRKNEDGDEE
jgi:hypothetical protein